MLIIFVCQVNKWIFKTHRSEIIALCSYTIYLKLITTFLTIDSVGQFKRDTHQILLYISFSVQTLLISPGINTYFFKKFKNKYEV